MKKLLVIIPALALCGCADLPSIITAAAKDPACAQLQVNTIYGTVTINRAVANGTNGITVNQQGIAITK